MKKISVIIPLAKNSNIEDKALKNNDQVILIKKFGRNPSKNRNLGIKDSKTELVAFTNGHSIISKNWTKEVLSFFNKYPDIDIVGGPQLTPKSQNTFARISGYALSSNFGTAIVSPRYKRDKINLDADENLLSSANLICKRKIFKKIKFDETIYPGEDPKFIEDARNNGFKIAYSPEIIVYNKRRTNPFSFIKQVYYYGKMRVKKEGGLRSLRKLFIIPALFVVYLISFIIYLLLFQLNIIFLIPLIMYLILDIYFSMINSVSEKCILCPFLLPLIYPAIHISYGIGFLKGLFLSLLEI